MNGLRIFYTLLAILFYKNVLFKTYFAKGNNVTQNSRSMFARKIENHRLLVDPVDSKITVESELDCMFKCTRKTGCQSFDLSLQGPDSWNCFLLSSDHNKHSSLLVKREGYDHYYFEDKRSITRFNRNRGKSNGEPTGVPRWRITTSDPAKSVINYNWTVDPNALAVNGADVQLRGKPGNQFILHTPGLDPSVGNVSFELAGHANHYVVAENGYIKIRVFEDTEAFKHKATFTRHVSSSKPGYETFKFQGLAVYNRPNLDSNLQYQKESDMSQFWGDIYWFQFVN